MFIRCLRSRGELHTKRVRKVEEFLDAFLEAEKFIAIIRVIVEDFQPLAKVGQRVQRVVDISTFVLVNVLQHLNPRRQITFDDEVDRGKVEIAYLSDLTAIEYLKGELITPLLTIGASNVNAEDCVDKAKTAEAGFLLPQQRLQGLEKRQGRERDCHCHRLYFFPSPVRPEPFDSTQDKLRVSEG